MPRRLKVPLGPSRLSKVLDILKKEPRPQLDTVKSLRLTLAFRNDHFGARHFVKEDLRRIRFVNPNMDIQVNKVPKTPEEQWPPELQVEFHNGTTQTINMDKKWSSSIFQELMDLAGGTPWQRWKKKRTAAGLPIVDPPTPKAPKPPKSIEDILFDPNRPKTGAAAILP
ncbi:uncharacterized protein B0H18DRAFT_957159 [Fomitopsis serialis]|uniref:uncharacterized protein n=1 Tax=Fomitopsis serialis TaxID=139415 RepID=UPI002007B600|nr:uncharacterized protein B0H18DRAFT_957159 [Neoantrodia serialis]KAH9920338.1 hypothetical protein B0H18DRAFT_957159 [Neoantrodia serialis]